MGRRLAGWLASSAGRQQRHVSETSLSGATGNTGRCILHIADRVAAPAAFDEEEAANVLSAGISRYSYLLSTPEARWQLTAADACRFHIRCLCLTLRVGVKRARFNPGAWSPASPALRSINRRVHAFLCLFFHTPVRAQGIVRVSL